MIQAKKSKLYDPEIFALQQSLNQNGTSFKVLNKPLDEDGIYGDETQKVYKYWLDLDTRIPTVTPTPVKPWWTSRAIIGLIATILAMIASKAGFEITNDEITQILLQVVELGGLIIAAWGTINRKAPIDPTLVTKIGTKEIRLPVKIQDDPRGVFKDL